MNHKISASLLALICASPFTQAAQAKPSSPAVNLPTASSDAETAIRSVFPALVRIYVVMEEGSEGKMRKMQGSGSGAIISPEGYVLTNHHVAGRGTRFVCTLSNRDEVDATLVGTDALSDLAILKLDLNSRRFKDTPLTVAPFGDSDQLKTGDVVFAMGSPGGLSQSVTRGIVANTALISPRKLGGLTLDGETVGELVRWIGHDAIIYPGNSGGPLVNPQGQIIGVNEVGIASLGGAIPSNLAKKVAAELIEKGKITRSWIGLEVQPLLRSQANQKGALVSTVWKDSPADKAGIKAGDFILTYQNTNLPNCHADEDIPVFNAMVLGTTPNTKVTLTGVRDGKPMTWEMTTLVRDPIQAKESESREWGLTLRNFTTMAALEQYRTSKDGVLVHSVRGGGPSAEAKPSLRANDIIVKANGKPVSNLAELDQITADFTKSLTSPKPMLVEFERDKQKFATVVKIGPVPDPVKPKNSQKPWFGAASQVLTDDLSTALGVPGKKGVRITSIVPDSPAAKAGLKEGDLLLKLDDKVINARRPEDSEVLPELIYSYPVNATLSFTGIRDGKEQSWSVPLAPRPVDDNELLEYKDDLFEFSVRELSSAQREHFKETHGQEPSGLSVLKIEPSGWTALAGLNPDDVILTVDSKPTNDINTLKSLLKQYSESKPKHVVFGIRRGPRTLYLEVEPRW